MATGKKNTFLNIVLHKNKSWQVVKREGRIERAKKFVKLKLILTGF